MDYVDLYQIHRWDDRTPIEETLEALHDVVKAGKARYIGASSMFAWQFATALQVATRHGWTRFVTMQNHVNLLYREEEREMLPLCRAEGIGVLPWSPLARGRLTRDWRETSTREETDEVGKKLYAGGGRRGSRRHRCRRRRGGRARRAAGPSRARLAATAARHHRRRSRRVARGHSRTRWPRSPVRLTSEELAALEAPYVPHPVSGI